MWRVYVFYILLKKPTYYFLFLIQIKGPYWPVPLGRRDGRVSIASESFTLPAPFANITQLKAQFVSKGLSVKDLAVLSGI